VVLRPGAEASEKDLIVFVGERLAKYKVPKSIRFVAQIPKSAVGKILRRALRDSLREKG